jgi:MftR C-terminal domain
VVPTPKARFTRLITGKRARIRWSASKEDILFGDFPALKEDLAHALAQRPTGRDALETVRDFALSAAHQQKGPFHYQRERIVASDETLRSHKRARLAQIEELVADAIARDLRTDADDLRPRLVAASLIAAVEVIDRRAESDPVAEDPFTAIEPVIALLRAGLEAIKTPSEKTARS